VIDLHTHVLAGIDDGPHDLAGSVAVAEVAAHGGVRTIVATPHLRADHPGVRPRELAGRAAELSEHLRERGLPVEIVPGAEVDLETAQELPDEELRLATLAANGRDLLLETPYRRLPRSFEEQVLALADRGFRITLAHPERNGELKEHPERVGALVARGVLVQLTARSLGARPSKTAALLLERGWAHVLASDAHAIEMRPPDLGASLRQAADTFPHARAELEWMVTAAPRAILDGVPLPARPEREARRRWWRR
jgi:protein-tyrosine phosphatase